MIHFKFDNMVELPLSCLQHSQTTYTIQILNIVEIWRCNSQGTKRGDMDLGSKISLLLFVTFVHLLGITILTA